jgi:hypothetical protein
MMGALSEPLETDTAGSEVSGARVNIFIEEFLV